MSTPHVKSDVHQEITNKIVTAIETAGEFQLPWIRSSGSLLRPVNVSSKKPYNGVNILSLWISALAGNYASNIWGTYRQWQERGCQVRKGEKSSLIVFYKTIEVEASSEDAEGQPAERMFARASHVFNAMQVDGFESPQESVPAEASFDPISEAERFVGSTGARIEESGDSACFVPKLDLIRMPERRRFVGTSTSSPAESWYSTLCHELVHWSGAKPRLDRDMTGRFGSESYAMEELVAELGAAFLCSDLGISRQPREDHACYIANWLRVLKSDKKAVFTAASKASEATNWLHTPSGAP